MASKVFSVKCQYCGEEFEAKSSRAKNCPACSKMMTEANKHYGAYAAAQTAAQEAMTIDITPAERRELIASAANQGTAEYSARMNQMRQRQRERKEAYAKRTSRNAFLRQHGYCWRNLAAMSFNEDIYANADASPDWALFAPDGREVTVTEAMAEIGANA